MHTMPQSQLTSAPTLLSPPLAARPAPASFSRYRRGNHSGNHSGNHAGECTESQGCRPGWRRPPLRQIHLALSLAAEICVRWLSYPSHASSRDSRCHTGSGVIKVPRADPVPRYKCRCIPSVGKDWTRCDCLRNRDHRLSSSAISRV
jgi:hypothetical protein